MSLRAAEDIKCGDIFLFRGVSYACVCSYTDARHATTLLVAAKESGDGSEVFALRLLRQFTLNVVGHAPLKLVTLEHSSEELEPYR